jgi:CRISPR/Cas system-associated endonuclease Cas1
MKMDIIEKEYSRLFKEAPIMSQEVKELVIKLVKVWNDYKETPEMNKIIKQLQNLNVIDNKKSFTTTLEGKAAEKYFNKLYDK